MGGNIEYAPEEMIKNGVTHVHLATGFLVGYPPCPYMEYFEKFIPERYGFKSNFGNASYTQKYFTKHNNLKTWNTEFLKWRFKHTLVDEKTRLNYD